MTDNDDAATSGGKLSPDGALRNDDLRASGIRLDPNRAVGRAPSSGASVRIAPTDPEVPSAKRRGAIRHHRSLVGLTAVIMGLLSITLALLYRASRQVRAQSDDSRGALRANDTRGSKAAASVQPGHKSPPTESTSVSPAGPGNEPHSDALPDDDSAPAGSGWRRSEKIRRSGDIIRAPSF